MQGNDDEPRHARDCCWLRVPTVVPLGAMAQSNQTGRTCPLLPRSGLVAAFLATAGIVAVEQSACADGFVRCWGSNGQGQCFTPPDLGTCSMVAAGHGHTIAIRSNGGVSCWGANDLNQCDTPSNLGSCTKVAGGGSHSIAVRSDGGVRCWGSNFENQCNIPTDISWGVIDVAAGQAFSIALEHNGNVRSWGECGNQNSSGWCPLQGDIPQSTFIAAGTFQSLSIGNTGSVKWWGMQDFLRPPANLGACSSVAGGYGHNIAIRSDGAVRCWGYGTTNTSFPEYGQSIVPADLGTCSRVAAGSFHSIALRTDGGVRCWGAGVTNTGSHHDFGQSNTPSDLGPCSRIAAGAYHSVAIMIGPRPIDTDGDGWPNTSDNCPTIANPTQADCNSNGVGDACEVAAGAPDFNRDTVPDTCQCLADLFVDRQVNGADLGALLSQWGPANANTVSDMNRDGKVDGADLGHLLASWGPCTN